MKGVSATCMSIAAVADFFSSETNQVLGSFPCPVGSENQNSYLSGSGEQYTQQENTARRLESERKP